MTFKHSLMRFAVAAALLGSAVPACDDSNDNPKPSDDAGKGGKGGKGGSSGKAGTGGKAGSTEAGKGGSAEAGKGGSAGGSDSAGKGGAGGAAGGSGGSGGSGADCKGVKDCFCGKPDKNDDFLNQCTENACTPYDNSKLTKLKDGKVPALP